MHMPYAYAIQRLTAPYSPYSALQLLTALADGALQRLTEPYSALQRLTAPYSALQRLTAPYSSLQRLTALADSALQRLTMP